MRFPLLFVVFLVIDQLSKLMAQMWLNEPIWLFPDVGFLLGYNEGIAFSLPLTGIWSVLVVLVVIGVLSVWYRRVRKSFLMDLSFSMIFAGAVGNLIDRLRFGAVVDFLHVYSWPIFNVADSLITVGFVLLLVETSRMEAQ